MGNYQRISPAGPSHVKSAPLAGMHSRPLPPLELKVVVGVVSGSCYWKRRTVRLGENRQKSSAIRPQHFLDKQHRFLRDHSIRLSF